MTHTQPTLLIVDDNEDMLEFLGIELGEKYSVTRAHDGIEALQLLEHQTFHLIVSDVMMPRMDGFEFCKQIKQRIEFCHIPLILLTAKNTLQSKIEGIELGADAYIEKPFSPEYLQAQIANLLKNRGKIKEHFAKTPLVHINSMAYVKNDELFLEQLHECILDQIDREELDVEHLAQQMNMSKATLYRKIKSLTNLSPVELINISRLKKAAALMAEGKYKIYEIADRVGFKTQAHFGKNFLKQFGVTPTEYMNSIGGKSGGDSPKMA